MASVEICEVRFIIEPEQTHCYVAYGPVSDGTLGVQGWHKRSFPASMSLIDILNGIGDGSIESAMLWGQEAPSVGRAAGHSPIDYSVLPGAR